MKENVIKLRLQKTECKRQAISRWIMSLIYIKANFKATKKTSITLYLLPRITCTGIRNFLTLFSVTLSITHSHTPALCITSDTKAKEMKHINKLQPVPLLSLIQRGEKKLFIFIYQFFSFFFSEPLIFFYLVVSWRQNNTVLQQQNLQPTTDKQSQHLCCALATTSVLKAENRWLEDDLVNIKQGIFFPFLLFFIQ